MSINYNRLNPEEIRISVNRKNDESSDCYRGSYIKVEYIPTGLYIDGECNCKTPQIEFLNLSLTKLTQKISLYNQV